VNCCNFSKLRIGCRCEEAVGRRGNLQSLRQHIGHAPILMVGAAILILDNQNRLLLMKRSDSVCWGPPGGATEPGEDERFFATCSGSCDRHRRRLAPRIISYILVESNVLTRTMPKIIKEVNIQCLLHHGRY
jgi:hypothetical protein